MTKLLILLALGALALHRITGKWPWELWAASERSQAEAQARALLGVERKASREAILAAHRKLITQVHPDRGGSASAVHAADAARDLLLAQIARVEAPRP